MTAVVGESHARGNRVVIVDTTVWVDYLSGASTPEVEWLDREAARVARHLRRFEIIETGGIQLAETAARNYRNLGGRGRTIRNRPASGTRWPWY